MKRKGRPSGDATLPEKDSLAEEAAYHEDFMESRLRVYVGREDVQEDLIAFAESDATHPCLVTGWSGSGKSAAVAHFTSSFTETHPEWLVIPHFVGAGPGSTSLRQMLRRFCLSLKDRFGLTEEVPLEVNELASRFRGALKSVPSDGRALLVIDALNQLDEADNAQSMWWLPWELPTEVKIVASCIDDPDRTDSVLKAMARRPLERVPIKPLTKRERREIIRRVPSLSAKTLDHRQVDLLLSNPATRNPLYLLVALEELRGFGSFEQLEARIRVFPGGSRSGVIGRVLAGLRLRKPSREDVDYVTDIFDQVLERLCEEFDGNVVRTVMAVLACARNGMSERELLEMVEGIGVEESTSDLFPVLRQLRPYLLDRMQAIDEGDSTLLDNSVLMSCSDLFEGDRHEADEMRILVGGGGGTLNGGRIIDVRQSPNDQHRACSVYLSIMDRMGVKLAKFGDTSHRLTQLH